MADDRFEYYQAKRGLLRRNQWRARVKSGGDILFVSSEGYNNLQDLLDIANRLFPDIPKVRVFT